MALYKYMSFQNAMHVLKGTIRFTQPGAFNDPFEMVPELHVPESFGGDKEINITFSVTAPRRISRGYELEPDFESDQCSDRNSRSIRSSLDQAIGILCLSKNPSSLLMWSHYADHYAGAVVEFDDSHKFLRGSFPIEYREQRPILDVSYYDSDNDPIPVAELCAKPKEWEHKREVRVIRNLSDCQLVQDTSADQYPVYVMTIPPECVKSITMGERMPVENQRRIWETIKDRELSLHLDAISNWGYGFRREHIKLPGMKNPITISPRTAHIFSQNDGPIGDIARWQLKSNKLGQVVNDTL